MTKGASKKDESGVIRAVGASSRVANEYLVQKPLAGLKYLLQHYIFAILAAAGLALVLRMFAFEAFRIPTDFMAPSLLPGDHIFVNKLAYGGKLGLSTHEPQRGDVIIVNFPSDARKDYIKRVIATGGDRVEIRDGIIHLNGSAIGKPAKPGSSDVVTERLDGHDYEARWTGLGAEGRQMIEMSVPAGHVFVLGDNRSKGQDSRIWGFVPVSYIKGRASVIWLSIASDADGDAEGVRWPRIFSKVN